MADRAKTNELIGPALDWAVECASGTHWSPNGYFVYPKGDLDFSYPFTKETRHYSTDWAQGGPIIEREGILFHGNPGTYHAWIPRGNPSPAGDGPTHLIAAMRCYVGSKLGDEVEIPMELK